MSRQHDPQGRDHPYPGALAFAVEDRDEGVEQRAQGGDGPEQRQQLGATPTGRRGAEVFGKSLDFGEARGVLLQLPLLVALAAQLGSGRRCRGNGTGTGTADAAQTKCLGNLGNGQRIDDAAGDTALHDQVAFLGEDRLARIVHLLLLVVVPNAGAGMIARLCCPYASSLGQY